MNRRIATAAVAAALIGATSRAEDTLRLLPSRPEVKVAGSRLGELLLNVRGRDITAFDFLTAISAIDGIHVILDDGAVAPLRAAVLNIDLREKPVLDVIDLVGAAAGVDVEKDVNSYRLMGAPLPGVEVEREALRQAAQRMYEQALTQPSDATLAATALRGMAELHRLSGDLFTAYSLYETLLTDPYRVTRAAQNCELLLADCYAGIGNPARASKLLRNFVDRSDDPRATERALRRLVGVLTDMKRYDAIEDLRGALAAVGTLEPETQKRIAETAAVMLKDGQARAAAVLLREVWSVDPAAHAALGPVLALALVMNGDPASAEQAIRATVPHLKAAADSSAAMWAFAEIARATHRDPEAVVFGSRALALPDAGADLQQRCFVLLAGLYDEIGLSDRARRHYYEAELLSSPQTAVDHALQSAEMTLSEGRSEHARLLFQAASEYGFRREEAELGVARALYQAKEPARALGHLRRLLERELAPELRERVRLLAVDCLEATGDLGGALTILDGDVGPLEQESQ